MSGIERRQKDTVVLQNNSGFYAFLLGMSRGIPSGGKVGRWEEYAMNFYTQSMVALMSRDAKITMESFKRNSSAPVDVTKGLGYELAPPIKSFNERIKTRSPVERASSIFIAGSPEVGVCDPRGEIIFKIQDVVVAVQDQPQSLAGFRYSTGTSTLDTNKVLINASPLVPMMEGKIVCEQGLKCLTEYYLDAIGAISRPRRVGFCINQNYEDRDIMYVSHLPLDWINSFRMFSGNMDTTLVSSKHPYVEEIIRDGGRRRGMGDRADDIIRDSMSPYFTMPNDPDPLTRYSSTRDATVGSILAYIHSEIVSELEVNLAKMSKVIEEISKCCDRKSRDPIRATYSTWPISAITLLHTLVNQPIYSMLGLSPRDLERMRYKPKKIDRRDIGYDY